MNNKRDYWTRVLIPLLLLTFSVFPIYAGYGERIDYRYSADTTLSELSAQIGIPITRLIDFFDLPQETERHKTLVELGITEENIEEARNKFSNMIWGFSWNIVLVGMIVIFSSLSLTGFFIGLLSKVVTFSERPQKRKQKAKKKLAVKEAKKVKIADLKSRDSGYNAVIAAITALHFHLQEAEELSKMTLAWKREPVSVWKTSGKFYMPNRVIKEKRG